jgi:uncharacterized oxidoreductase
MKVSGNTILIKGGATGIGFALAARFTEKGNQVIICGRRREKLDQAKITLPGVITRAAINLIAPLHLPSLILHRED